MGLIGWSVAPFAGDSLLNAPGAVITVNDQPIPASASLNTVQPASAQARTCQ
jgi:hypothetical protein